MSESDRCLGCYFEVDADGKCRCLTKGTEVSWDDQTIDV